MKIAMIGAGNMGKAILAGLVRSKMFEGQNIIATGRNEAKIKAVGDELGIRTSTDNIDAIKDAEWIIFCVQPATLDIVLKQVQNHIKPTQRVVSCVAGYSIKRIKEFIPNNKVMLVMPNTAIAKQQSMSFLCTENNEDDDALFAKKMFDSIGKTMFIDEDSLHAATILGSSSIAYFLRFFRALTLGGVQMGLHPNEAQEICAQVAVGAASLISDGGHAEEEIDKVTTPKGCTIEGLNEMEHGGLSSAVISGLMAAYDKINSIKKD